MLWAIRQSGDGEVLMELQQAFSDKIDNLEAGPELDRRIILDVMGWKPWEGEFCQGMSGEFWCIGSLDYETPQFCPSTDISAAWEVAGKLNGFSIGRSGGDGSWMCSCHGALAQAETAPLAICRAALKAVRR